MVSLEKFAFLRSSVKSIVRELEPVTPVAFGVGVGVGTTVSSSLIQDENVAPKQIGH